MTMETTFKLQMIVHALTSKLMQSSHSEASPVGGGGRIGHFVIAGPRIPSDGARF